MPRLSTGNLWVTLILAGALSLSSGCTDVEFSEEDAGGGMDTSAADTTSEDTATPPGDTGTSETGQPDTSAQDTDGSECTRENERTFFPDNDGDGFGTGSEEGDTIDACEPPDGYTPESGDCDDTDPSIHPDAEEKCDQVDRNCDNDSNKDAVDGTTYYKDADGDGWGSDDDTVTLCSAPEDQPLVDKGGDCNDSDDTIHPNATEVCDGADNDCDAKAGGTTASKPVDESHIADQLSAGGSTCAITGDKLRCWGPNDAGQLGYGDQTARHAIPVGNISTPGSDKFVDIAVGRQVACGITDDRKTWCWGSNLNAGLGVGSSSRDDSANSPVPVQGLQRANKIYVGDGHGCITSTKGYARCWGYNKYGQVGTDSSDTFILSATSIADGPSGGRLIFDEMALGSWHTCGLDNQGTAYCWGYNIAGQLGTGDRMERRSPTRVATKRRFETIAAGGTATCGLDSSGNAFCWGQNTEGQLGDGSTSSSSRPVVVKTQEDFVDISVGETHTCALNKAGEAFCWGRNLYGEIGGGSGLSQKVKSPEAVKTSLKFKAIAAGRSHTCGLTKADGNIVCWGRGLNLGTGSSSGTNSNPTPQWSNCQP